MNFNDIISKIKKNSQNQKEGYNNCIPYYGLERLEKVVPGIMDSEQIILTASSGIGKSQLARYLYIHSPLNYVEKHPELGIKLDIKLFSLEESKEAIICKEISRYLYLKHKLRVSPQKIMSIGKYNVIEDKVLKAIEESREHIESFLSKVDIIDNIWNPSGIYKYCRDFALKIGRYYDKNGKQLTVQEHYNIANGIGKDFKKISYYKKNDERHFVIIILDHISLKDWRS